MRLKKAFLCLIITAAALFSFAGCSDTSVEDAELNQKLIGGWVPLNDANYSADENGNTLSFTVYEFTGTITKVHEVATGVVYSYFVNEYEIKDGKFKVAVDGHAEFAKIGFADDGNLLWYTDSEITEFRPVTDEEVLEFGIPLGETLSFELDEEESSEQVSDDVEGSSEQVSESTGE